MIERVNGLFSDRMPIMSLWQELAENFYVERADFTVNRSLGQDFAGHLITSYPLMVRRDLANSIGSMLRPSNKDWFKMAVAEDIEDNEAKTWLERATKIQRRAMYDKKAQFVKAVKQGDNDFATFGQCVIFQDINSTRDALIYQNFHIRDVVWREDDTGVINFIGRKWAPEYIDVVRLFAKQAGNQPTFSKLKDKAEKSPFAKADIRHIIMPRDQWDTINANKSKLTTPFVSVYICVETGTILEEVGAWNKKYTIPRWVTIAGSQYAYSAASVIALPDARLIQAQSLTLLEAGEKAVNPPMIATMKAVRSDIALYAGGTTWVDDSYDERMGEVLRPITQDKSGLNFGLEEIQDTREMLHEAFFLNKIALPPADGSDKMTAYETGERVKEYIRHALPLFEPMEADYNGELCDITFDNLMRVGAFGPYDQIPDSIRGEDVNFRFESPITEAMGAEKGQKYLQSQSLIAQAIQLDPRTARIFNAKEAVRDALDGVGTPAKWLNSEKEVEQMEAQDAQAQQQQALLAQMQQGSEIADNLGSASKSFSESQVNQQALAQ